MTRGFWHSLFGLLFFPVPGLGLLLSISGFIRQVVRITRKHRVRNVFFTLFALISLIVAVSALAYEAYVFSRDPGIVDRLAHQAWQTVTGQEEYPWAEAPAGEGTDYGDAERPGLGLFDDDEYLGDDGYTDEGVDLDSLPDLEAIMEDIRNPFAQFDP